MLRMTLESCGKKKEEARTQQRGSDRESERGRANERDFSSLWELVSNGFNAWQVQPKRRIQLKQQQWEKGKEVASGTELTWDWERVHQYNETHRFRYWVVFAEYETRLSSWWLSS